VPGTIAGAATSVEVGGGDTGAAVATGATDGAASTEVVLDEMPQEVTRSAAAIVAAAVLDRIVAPFL